MTEAYAACSTYRDTGSVTSRVEDGPILRGTLRTAFRRPDRLRFAYLQPVLFVSNGWVVWCDGRDVRRWSSMMGTSTPESLQLALAEAAGVTGGAAQLVPKLLLGEAAGGSLLTVLEDVQRLEDSAVGGQRCHVVTGHFADGTVTLWIDQETNLLRRAQILAELDDGTPASTTMDLEPSIDEEIGDDELAFDVADG
jgi:outer membrane lipoprotein-sorting protein